LRGVIDEHLETGGGLFQQAPRARKSAGWRPLSPRKVLRSSAPSYQFPNAPSRAAISRAQTSCTAFVGPPPHPAGVCKNSRSAPYRSPSLTPAGRIPSLVIFSISAFHSPFPILQIRNAPPSRGHPAIICGRVCIRPRLMDPPSNSKRVPQKPNKSPSPPHTHPSSCDNPK